MKKALILIITAVILILLMAVGATAAPNEPYYPFYNYYQHVPVTITLTELPKTIRGQFDYDRDFIDVYPSYPGYEDRGFLFPLTDEKYGAFYNVKYTVDDTIITYEYTLKNNVSLENFEKKNWDGSTNSDGDPLYQFPVFDIAMKLNVTRPPAKIVDHKILDLETVVGTTVYRNGEKLGTCYEQYYIVQIENLDYVPPTETPTPHRLSRLIEQYNLNIYALTEYEEIYDHTDENGEVDWAIVKAATEIKKTHGYTMPCYYEFGNRVLETEYEGKPFKFDIGIFSVKDDRFYDVNAKEILELDDIEFVWTNIGKGRLIGDMNGDNELDITDAVLIQRCLIKLAEYPADDKNHPIDMVSNPIEYFSDFNQNGERDILDATAIQRFLIRLPYRPEGWIPYPHALPTEAPDPKPIEPDPTQAPTEPAPTQPTTPAEPVSSIPQITGFKSTGRGVEVSLSTVPGAEKYRVYHKDPNGGWTKLGETEGKIFIDEDVDIGKAFTYTVRCIKADLSEFTSDFDRTGWTYAYDPKLDTPEIIRVEAAGTYGAKITWKPVDGADQYRVYYKLKHGEWTKLEDTRQTSCIDTEISDGGTRIYTVRCLSQGAKGFASDYEHDGTEFYLMGRPSFATPCINMDSISIRYSGFSPNTRLYKRSEGGEWEQIAVLSGKGTYYDYDVVPGTMYYYTARVASDDGTYFLTNYYSRGYFADYSVNNCEPEFEFVIYMGDNLVLVQPKDTNLFDIRSFAVIVKENEKYIGTYYITDEPCYLRGDIFEEGRKFNFDLVGLDENKNWITRRRQLGFNVTMLSAPTDLKAEKTGDRKYRFMWENAAFSDGGNLNLFSEDGEYAIESDFVKDGSYEVDLSGYPEDITWSVLLWSCKEKETAISVPVAIEFREADYK